MKFLLLNQTFPPDVVATGQYLAEAAQALAERGHEVTVVTSLRAYDDPRRVFPKEERWRGIRVLRVGSTGLGKGARWRRAADFGSFLACCCARLLRLPRQDVVVALTSPPLISFIGALLARLRGSRFVYWVMDFNPDEAIAAGWLRRGSLAARMLEGMSRFSLRQAARVIALDGFMRERIVRKGIPAERVVVLPPWAQGEVRFDAEGRERFRKAHGLEDKFVVMYSGNHSPCHPLDTLLAAAKRLAREREVAFCFVGGGSEWRKLKNQELNHGWTRMNTDGDESNRGIHGTHGNSELIPSKTSLCSASSAVDVPSAAHSTPPLHNFITAPLHYSIPPPLHQSLNSSIHQPSFHCLPYQPYNELSASLSAADLQVVVMGEAFVGLVHPCKIYNLLAVGAPVLYVGPVPSHVSEILDALPPGYPAYRAAHGDVDGVVRAIREARAAGRGRRGAAEAVFARFARDRVLPRLVEEMAKENS